MDYFWWFLPCTLYVAQNSFNKVKVNSTIYGYAKIKERPQLFIQSIDALNNHNAGARDFDSPTAHQIV